jgi:hypothetical protein
MLKERQIMNAHGKRWLVVGLAALFAAGIGAAPVQAQSITPKPIPPGFHFPTPAPIITGWIAASNTKAIRQHGWDLWAGMSVDSKETFNGKSLPIWETWYGSEELFTPQASTAAGPAALLKANRMPGRAFIAPHQFKHMLLKLKGKGAIDGSPAAQVVSFNKFDPKAAEFIVSPHAGPGGAMFHYNSGTSLAALNSAWPATTPANLRTTAEFPAPAIELKPVMGLVSQTGLTPTPLWRGPDDSTNATNPTPNTWKTCVLIDPRPTAKGAIRPATAAEIKSANPATGLACKTYLYGPLSLLYSFQMSAAEAAAFTTAQGTPAVAGDYAVLDAMHVNSKEIPLWTWQTFYWQPGADTPKGFPGSKKNMPASLKAPWNNYAMCAAYSQTTTPTGTTMQVCFNPYLETSPNIPSGITSNCMSCHGVALVPGASANYPPSYPQPIPFFTDPTYYTTSVTRTDFSWAVASAPN